MADYIISTTSLEEEALTAFVAKENDNAPSAGQEPWPSNAAYITAAAQRMILDPLVAGFVETVVLKLGAQARLATLAQLQAADDALPEVP